MNLLSCISENGIIALAAIAVLETLILTSIVKNYSIEVDGEVSKNSLKGSMKLQPA